MAPYLKKRLVVLSVIITFITIPFVYGQAGKIGFKFDFGTGKTAGDYIKVTPETMFNERTGYGFDFGSKVTAIRNNKKALTGDYITAAQPFYFSVNVPEGNYKVTVTLGDSKGTSNATIRAESRRLMLERIATTNGGIKKLSFIVNIRKPTISTGGKVARKPREFGKLDWDDKLTLEFNNTHPCIDAVEIEKVDDQVTVYLAGNSTVVDQEDEPWASWDK